MNLILMQILSLMQILGLGSDLKNNYLSPFYAKTGSLWVEFELEGRLHIKPEIHCGI